MSHVDDQSTLAPFVRTMQIMIVVLTAGLVVFLAIVLSVRTPPQPDPPGPAAAPAQTPPVLGYAAFAIAALSISMSLSLPAVMVKNAREKIARGTWTPPAQATETPPPGPAGDTSRLAAVYLNSRIVGAALNEFPAFFALIAYMLEDRPAVLGLAVLLILGVAARFPTRERVGRWIDAQKEQLLLDRQVGG